MSPLEEAALAWYTTRKDAVKVMDNLKNLPSKERFSQHIKVTNAVNAASAALEKRCKEALDAATAE